MFALISEIYTLDSKSKSAVLSVRKSLESQLWDTLLSHTCACDGAPLHTMALSLPPPKSCVGLVVTHNRSK